MFTRFYPQESEIMAENFANSVMELNLPVSAAQIQ
jgi:hypothetical protein